MPDIFAKPRVVTKLDDCIFYHTMDIPGYGVVDGQWDLRDGVRDYLGGVNFKGKSVLEIGSASGFLCFWMEGQGADLIAHDLSSEQDWDLVPFAGYDVQANAAARREHIRRLNNGYWLAHQANKSRARVIYRSIYDIPREIEVDVSTLGSVLLHVRDPFLALQSAARVTKETMIVTDRVPDHEIMGPTMEFLPNSETMEPKDTWWWLSPQIITRFLGVLGFDKATITTHKQNSKWGKLNLFTIVANR